MKTTLFISYMFLSLFLYSNNSLSQNITAKYNIRVVDSLVYTLDPNAKLRFVWSDSVLTNGTSLSWNYQYASFSNDTSSLYFLHSTGDSIVFDSLSHLEWIGIVNIDSTWIDSDSALIQAENKGGKDFRDIHPNFKIIAQLYKTLYPNSTNHWHITYISLTDSSDRLNISLDASGDSIVSVKNIKELSNDLILYQNYPNPFNPTCKIDYSIKDAGLVTIKVFNILGQQVAELVNDIKQPGNYEVNFNGSKLASGIYIYRIKAGEFTDAKKMLLIK